MTDISHHHPRGQFTHRKYTIIMTDLQIYCKISKRDMIQLLRLLLKEYWNGREKEELVGLIRVYRNGWIGSI